MNMSLIWSRPKLTHTMHQIKHIMNTCGAGTAWYTPERRFFNDSKMTRSARRSTRSAVSNKASENRQPV